MTAAQTAVFWLGVISQDVLVTGNLGNELAN